MTFNQLASKIAKMEGKKHQATIGDIKEILKCFFDLISDEASADYEPTINLMQKEFKKRLKK